jgi:hypothetical protein
MWNFSRSKQPLTVCLIACLTIACLPLLANADAAWLPNYNRRMLFYWQSTSAGQDSFTVYNQTGFNSDSQFYIFNETQADFEDLRVTLSDGETLLPIWNQTTFNGVNCTVWTDFPVANASYYLYWNNLGAEAVWSQDDVFNAVLGNVCLALPMNEGTGTPIEYSGNGLTVTNNAEWTTGVYGSALLFNGSTSHVQVNDANVIDFTNKFSFAFYMNMTGYGGNNLGRVLDKAVYAVYDNSGSLSLKVDGGVSGVSSNPSFSLNSNVFVTVTYDASLPFNNLKFYFNGTLKNSVNTTTSFSVNNNVLFIGNRADLLRGFNGTLSNVFLFNGSLSAVQVGALAAGYGDGRLESGKVLVRNYLVGASVSLFGSVESAPVVEPTVDPDVLTGEDAVGVAVALFVVAIAVCVGLVFAFKQAE